MQDGNPPKHLCPLSAGGSHLARLTQRRRLTGPQLNSLKANSRFSDIVRKVVGSLTRGGFSRECVPERSPWNRGQWESGQTK